MEPKRLCLEILLLEERLDFIRNAKGLANVEGLIANVEGLALRHQLIRIERDYSSIREQPSARLDLLYDGFGERATNAIRVDIDAVGEGILKLILEVGGTIVDAPVDPEIFYHPIAPVLATGKSDDVTAGGFRELRNDGADRSSGSGDRNSIRRH